MYEETLEGYAKLHRDQGGDKRKDGDITGSKTSPCMTLDIVYLILKQYNFKNIFFF